VNLPSRATKAQSHFLPRAFGAFILRSLPTLN
jgi:hypothetical protein